MAHVGNGSVNSVEDDDCFEDAYDRIPVAGKMDLKTSIEECSMALNLVLNNKFSEALELLKPWWKNSMYHALGYSSILVMQAAMTFEHRDIQTAMAVIKEALNTCQRFRKRNSVVESLSSLVIKQTNDNLREEEMHAEICYAECLLQKATLTFVQDENMISFIKGGIKIRTSYQIYKSVPQNSQVTYLAVITHCALSPQDFGLAQLREGAASHSIRAILSVLTLLFYHTYVTLILGTLYTHTHTHTHTLLCHNLSVPPQARLKFEECILAQSQWRQIHHLCYWELMWSHSFTQDWPQAYRYADLLCKESRWSKAIYVYQKAAILSMMPEEEVKKTGENVIELFRQVEGLKQRLAGKSIPTEKFAVRKSRRYNASNPVRLVVPALEMMYVWNGFTIVGKRADHTESLLITLEKAEEKLNTDPSPSEYHPDDQCLVQMLKGLCLKHLGRLLQAELCFTQVLSSERRIRYDHYLIPFTLYELGLLYKQQGDFIKATQYIENAKLNYKDYSMESRLHFRIHAALNSLKGSPVITP
uniref:Tetratricopeptide repeat protein 39B n=1 Tax=Esox lucius TaxID=8010 RepID=A0A6Q2YJ33_ESOLU